MLIPTLLVFLVLAGVVGGWFGWREYRRLRTEYDAYRTRIQPGARVAGVEVGWLPPEEARARVQARVADPYFDPLALQVLSEGYVLPIEETGWRVGVDAMVQVAVNASHQEDYWAGFWAWLTGDVPELELDVPLRTEGPDRVAIEEYVETLAAGFDLPVLEPEITGQPLAFFPGHAGRALDTEAAVELIVDAVPAPSRRELRLPVVITEPRQGWLDIHRLVVEVEPVLEQAPVAPSVYTDTKTVGWPDLITDTESVAYIFDRGQPGQTLDVEASHEAIQDMLREGQLRPVPLVVEAVPQTPLTAEMLNPVLQARLDRFPGVTAIRVKNLDTGEVAIDQNTEVIFSGMSIIKIGIMVEVFRYHEGEVDAQTEQELRDMLGSSSCNPCANRLLAQVSGGSPAAGAAQVTNTMRKLGMKNAYLCGPFRVEARRDSDLVWASWRAAADPEDVRYDRCVRATPGEMADLVEMIYAGAEGTGMLLETYPALTRDSCDLMLDIMAANDLRNMLGAGIPDDVRLAHKHGFSGYAVPWGDTRGEVGITYSHGADYLVSFYIWQDTDWINWEINSALYRDVSNMLYNFYNPDAPYYAPPSWTPPEEPDEETDGSA
jgi:hypothetical protein